MPNKNKSKNTHSHNFLLNPDEVKMMYSHIWMWSTIFGKESKDDSEEAKQAVARIQDLYNKYCEIQRTVAETPDDERTDELAKATLKSLSEVLTKFLFWLSKMKPLSKEDITGLTSDLLETVESVVEKGKLSENSLLLAGELLKNVYETYHKYQTLAYVLNPPTPVQRAGYHFVGDILRFELTFKNKTDANKHTDYIRRVQAAFPPPA